MAVNWQLVVGYTEYALYIPLAGYLDWGQMGRQVDLFAAATAESDLLAIHDKRNKKSHSLSLSLSCSLD